jgi:hypothetical protein
MHSINLLNELWSTRRAKRKFGISKGNTDTFNKFQLFLEDIYELLLKVNKNFWKELIAYFHSIRPGPQRKRRLQQFFYCCVFIHYRGNVFTEPLPSNNKRHTNRHTDWWEGFMKYAVEMGSGASRAEVNSRDIQTAWWSHKPTFFFSK